MLVRRPWQEELAIIDRTMKAISSISDPEALVEAYWSGIGELLAIKDFVAVSRRGVEPPDYLITRSSRFAEQLNPWTQRDRLPRVTGGLLGRILYDGTPVVMDDLPAHLTPDDPARSYLDGFQSLVSMPQYDGGEALNATMILIEPGVQIDHSMIPMLYWQTSLFGRGTQNLVLRNQLAAALEALQRELDVVGQIQRSLLPPSLPSIEGFDLAAHYQTSARAGGDYYDFFPLEGRQGDAGWGVFIADVSGHGTPSAVLMAITHAIAHAQPDSHTPPATLIRYLNEQLVRLYTHDGAFVTAFYAALDPIARSLAYSRAGHNPPRLLRDGRIISLDQSGSLPLGILDGQSFAESKVPLERGDLLLLYTDGITEAMAPPHGAERRELFGTARLDALLQQCGRASASQCIDLVRSEVAAFSAAPPADDQTLIAIRCL